MPPASISSLKLHEGKLHASSRPISLCMLSLASFRDFKKFMERDRHGLDSNVLRFVACMDTTRPIDMDRRFIVFFHLSDDTIAVFEPPQRNSGTYCTECVYQPLM